MKILTNEMFFRGQPDKLADQIADKIVTEYLKVDPKAKINIDIVGGEGTLFATGVICSFAKLNIKKISFDLLEEIGSLSKLEFIDNIEYKKECNFNEDDIIVYGYACNETEKLLPKSMVILQEFSRKYDELTKKDVRFLPDGKVAITALYDDDNRLLKIKSANINFQNTNENKEELNNTIESLFTTIANKFDVEVDMFIINSAGKFLKGGFERDTGLTGRRPGIDNYLGFAKENKISLSGKDPTSLSKVGIFKAREIAKNILINHNLEWCEVIIDFSRGVKLYIDSNKGKIKNCDVCNYNIDDMIKELKILNKNYVDLAAFGYFQ